MLPADSVVVAPRPVVKAKPQARLTPAQVVKWMPKDATPQQLDSAIQRHIKASPIHWSKKPDTLHLPGLPGHDPRDVELPIYYEQTYVSQAPHYHPEVKGGARGVSGNEIPYSFARDNIIIGVLVACFLLTTIAFAKGSKELWKRCKNFFYQPREKTSSYAAAATFEKHSLRLLIVQTCLLFSLLIYCAVDKGLRPTLYIDRAQLLGLLVLIMIVYFLLKTWIYRFVNWVFFDKTKYKTWLGDFLFLLGACGIILFPATLALVFYDVSLKNISYFVIAVVILFKIFVFYRSFIIFFKRKNAYLQIILYFCALEIVPVLLLYGALKISLQYLSITI